MRCSGAGVAGVGSAAGAGTGFAAVEGGSAEGAAGDGEHAAIERLPVMKRLAAIIEAMRMSLSLKCLLKILMWNLGQPGPQAITPD